MPPLRKFSMTDTLQGMRVAFEKDRALVIRITLLFAFVIALSGLLDLTGPAGIAISLGFFVLFGAMYQGLITALVCLPGKVEGLGELWQAVRSVLATLIWVALAYTGATVLGLLAFFVPGLMILTIWSVAGQVVVVERKGLSGAFRRSAELIRGNGFAVFGFLLVIGIIALTISLLAILVARPLGTGVIGNFITPFLSNMFSAPFYALGLAALYNELTGRGINPEPAPPGQETRDEGQ
ncbi:MAG TPA: hypothetical protein P5138_00190 [Solirubrobacterales bacterium]|nr:hypothetical protein [Solirubrobacterales bacterium]HRV59024.1 hypothetical protein [Solirubrobacterales bacterium]